MFYVIAGTNANAVRRSAFPFTFRQSIHALNVAVNGRERPRRRARRHALAVHRGETGTSSAHTRALNRQQHDITLQDESYCTRLYRNVLRAARHAASTKRAVGTNGSLRVCGTVCISIHVCAGFEIAA